MFRLGRVCCRLKTRTGLTQRNFSFSLPTPRKLDDTVVLSKLREEEPETIRGIWASHFYKNKSTQSALGWSISAEEYNKVNERAMKCRMFIYPVFKENGHFIMLSQYQDSIFMLTYLEDYKSNPAAAQPWQSLCLYTDLLRDKNLCLLRSDFLPNLQREEAERLGRLLLLSYTDDALYDQISTFNLNPGQFSYDLFLTTYKDL